MLHVSIEPIKRLVAVVEHPMGDVVEVAGLDRVRDVVADVQTKDFDAD